MKSLYQQVKHFFASDAANEVVSRQNSNLPSDSASSPSRTSEQRRCFTGVVTSISGESGLIDNHVYFDCDVIVGGRNPVVGGAAHVTAARPHEHAGWRAVRVDLTSEWHPEESSATELVVGVVTGLSRTRCVVECGQRQVTFAPGEYRPASGYRPHLGDSVEVSCENSMSLWFVK